MCTQCASSFLGRLGGSETEDGPRQIELFLVPRPSHTGFQESSLDFPRRFAIGTQCGFPQKWRRDERLSETSRKFVGYSRRFAILMHNA
jgi:hypothetical protein